jgi:hypothetical protein
MQLPNDLTLRLAKVEDREHILPLMLEFKEQIPLWRHLPVSNEAILDTIDTYIRKMNDDKDTTVILVHTLDMVIVGLIVGTASRMPFNYQLQASETIWYVSLEYRKSGIGLYLYKAFEHWAINVMKAELLHTGAPTESGLNKIFKDEGYSLFEEVYFKEVA